MGHDLPEQWEKESDPDPQKSNTYFNSTGSAQSLCMNWCVHGFV